MLRKAGDGPTLAIMPSKWLSSLFSQAQRSSLAIFTPEIVTSTTPTMAGSLEIAAQSPPNPTNTLTNVSATGGGVVCGDSAAICTTNTAEAVHK